MLKPLLKPGILVFSLFVLIACVYLPGKKEVIALNIVQPKSTAFKGFLGINGFEWDFFKQASSEVDSQKVRNIQSFSGFRHYMDWEKIESEKGKYTFNPTHSGGFDYDKVYQLCSQNDIEVLACLKNCPAWLVDTYPSGQRDVDNVPAPYGLNRSDPSSYILQAKAAFQFAARYGNNKTVNPAMVNINKTPRWTNDPANTVEIGLGYVHYMECNNEIDKTWKGEKAKQNPEEYAANLSAFYDGNKGKLGKNVGVKNADPSMQVVMSGLSNPDPGFVISMIEWCEKNRGYKADGSVNLCFDVINYHSYNNDGMFGHDYTVGRAPELSSAAKIADDFVAMSAKYAKGMDVWITEAGYDINPQSKQKAIAIGNKPALITQADWMLRSAFLYARHGLKKAFFYMLDDVDKKSATSYASSGFVDGNKKRPVADYFLQVKKLLGEYAYQQTLSADPIVDVYSAKDKRVYVLYVPDEVGRKATYELDLHGDASAKVYYLVPGADNMKQEIIPVKNGKIKLEITETPIFVEKIN
ncbi:MAG TPA: hypothetical protein VGC01_04810 [Mucilaginibacter sp.]